jgi:succinyl-CoA synthetase beta subunit
MDLLESKGKHVLARYDLPLLAGKEASTVDVAVAAAEEIGYPVVVKAQVKIGGRGKLGGIKIAESADEVREHATNILGMDIRGHTVHEVWLQKATEIASEYYGAVVFDRAAKAPLVMLSTEGGMEIEQVAAEHPDALATLHVDPLVGFQPYQARRLAFEAGVDPDVVGQIGDLLSELYEVFTKEDATLVEINPIVVTPDREVVALDAKITLDDNSLFRHPDNAGLDDLVNADPQEMMAA